MNSAYTLNVRPMPAARPSRAFSSPAPRVRRAARRGFHWNALLGALIAALVGFYFAAYVATVFAVGDVERAQGASGRAASSLHDAERAAMRGGALSYGDAAAVGLTEVAPRFVSAAGAPRALSMNGR